MADQDGKVISMTDKGLIVEYKDKTKHGFNIGRIYGKAEGSIYPHDIVTPLQLNDSFKKGDPIIYNSGFFEPNFINPKQIVMKASVVAKTAIMEIPETYEDSSIISEKLSKDLIADTTYIKSYTVNFKDGIRDMVKVGSYVKPTDTLFIIEDQSIVNLNEFSARTINTLKKLSNKAPRAKMEGKIDRIEVFYHGDKEDMHLSLRELTNKSDKELRHSQVSANLPAITGLVNGDYRVEGKPLLLDTAEIKIYITVSNGFNNGDKAVFANQMKSVTGEVMPYPMVTEQGDNIEAVFSFRAIAARITLSPIIIGTTTTLLKHITKKAVELYRK